MRDIVSTALELAGMAATSVGFGLFSVPLGLIVAGICLFAVGYRLAVQ